MKRFKYHFAGCLLVLMAPILALGQVTITHFRSVADDHSVIVDLKVVSPKAKTTNAHVRIVSCSDGSIAWQGTLPSMKLSPDDTLTWSHRIEGIQAKLWSPVDPQLYHIWVTIEDDSTSKRIGFRRFEMREGRFYLNGKPIFLRGNSINPPGRGIPDKLDGSKEFARDYVRFLKGMNVNLIRVRNNQNWLDVCDEEGMMIFGGRYGRPRTGKEKTPPQDLNWSVNHYKEVELGPLAWHPSVVIFVLSNEQADSGEAGKAYDHFLSSAYRALRQWDSTRLYIGNAGYGLGRNADIYDAHRYWGWYYNTFLTFLNLRNMNLWQNPGKVQPITFTECVGNYTGIDGRYNLCSRTKQPYSQLCWTGHTPQSEQGPAALKYQAFVLKNTVEMFRRLRCQNERLAGVMPFTILFHHWDGISSFAEMAPKPAAFQYKTSYQPILLSWEMWMPNVYAGNTIRSVVHIVNDDDWGQNLDQATVEWALEDINRIPVVSGTFPLPQIPYYGTYRTPVEIAVPQETPTGYYTLRGTVFKNGKIVSQNNTEIFIAGPEWENTPRGGRKVTLYDPKGFTRKALDRLGIVYDPIDKIADVKPSSVLVIGELAWDPTLSAAKKQLQSFMAQGGRIVCLRQPAKFDTSWLPARVRMITDTNDDTRYLGAGFTYKEGMNINMERAGHPIFEGISRDKLRLWSDYTQFDESKPGLPCIYPVTQGFDLAGNNFKQITVYANYSRGLAATALCEINSGKGSILLSGFDLAPRSGIDPIADRLLLNLMNFARSSQSSNPYTYIDQPIFWGDFVSEKGIASIAHNGLLLNTVPVVPADQRKKLPTIYDDQGYWYAGVRAGGWNTKPGVQYMPYGRRPFAEFTYSRGGNVVARGDNRHARGFFLAEVPANRTRMITTVMNPDSTDIALTIKVNGAGRLHTIPARSTLSLETALPENRKLEVTFEGDRKAVLLKTEFK